MHPLVSEARRLPRPRLRVRNQRWFAMVWLTVTLIFFGLILAAGHIRQSDEVRATAVAEDVVLAMQSDAPGRAYDMATPAFRKAISQEQLGQVFSQLGPVARQARIDMIDRDSLETGRGNPQVAVVYRLDRGQERLYLRLVIEKQGGRWLLYNIYTSAQPMKARQGN